jgi:hypothetical protein
LFLNYTSNSQCFFSTFFPRNESWINFHKKWVWLLSVRLKKLIWSPWILRRSKRLVISW